MRPIRKDLLIDTIIYYPPKPNDLFQDDTRTEPMTVTNVRVEAKRKHVQDRSGSQVVANSILYHDAVHSTPCEYEVGGEIEYNGQRLYITGIDEMKSRYSIHHWEVLLI